MVRNNKKKLIFASAIILSANGFSLLEIDPVCNTLEQHSGDDGKSKIHTFEGVVRLKLHADIKMECVISPEFRQHFVNWKLKVCRNVGQEGEVMSIYLISIFSEDTEAWSCRAAASFKLLGTAGRNPLERQFAYDTFNNEFTTKGIEEFITWNELEEKYVENGVATFDVKISTEVPNRVPKIQHISTKFNMKLRELSKLGDQYSSEISIRGIRWRVLATKKDGHLAVFVYANENDMDLDFSWEVSASFQLVSLSSNQSVLEKFSGVIFDWTNSDWGFSNFIKWSDLFDTKKQFVTNDATLLQIELTVGKPKPKPYS